MSQRNRPSFFEFFAGGGMARAGLGPSWRCLFANDIDEKKAESYRANWGSRHLVIDDVRNITAAQIPGEADLAWASFPCQDLSLAGNQRGLDGTRSGKFWAFWKIMRGLAAEHRGPRMIVLENVCGVLTSHFGQDFGAIASVLNDANYVLGAVTMDARLWIPQSRRRLFIVGIRDDLCIPEMLRGDPSDVWHSRPLRTAFSVIAPAVRDRWVWWNLPLPSVQKATLADIIEANSREDSWNSAAETDYLISLMSALNRKKLDSAITVSKRTGTRLIGSVYKRRRQGLQRAEIRFDEVVGCLRTPIGGSSRQTIMLVEDGCVRSRLLSPREAARLMGLPDTYILPCQYNQSYHLCGDGVVVPVVRHLASHLLEPIWSANRKQSPKKFQLAA
jgi:DNA (cytosine-5)-methyltransferase 1